MGRLKGIYSSRPTAVAIWSAALLVAGAWAASRAPVEWAPQVELPEVRVSGACRLQEPITELEDRSRRGEGQREGAGPVPPR